MRKKILIVGGGPVGLAAALFLNASKQNIRIVEKSLERSIYSRALMVNTRTLTLLHQMGVSQEIIRQGSGAEGMHALYNGKEMFAVDFNKHVIPSTSFYGQRISILSQSKVEKIMEDKLKSQGFEVERGVELEDVKNVENNKVETVLRHPDGRVVKDHFDMVIGCDGAKSVLRHKIGAQFQGSTVEGAHMYLADYALKEEIKDKRFALRLNTQSDTPHISFTIPIGGSDVRVFSNNPNFEQTLPKDLDFTNSTQIWRSEFKLNHRISNKLREGNIFLAGDAAHVHSPIGGRGMNIGIEDVYVLSELLKTNELSLYDDSRRPVLQKMVKQIKAASQMMMIPSAEKYKHLGRVLPTLWSVMPEWGYIQLLKFITGQDHEV